MDLLKKNIKYIDQVIDMALAEDIGPGDVTTDIVIPESAILNGIFRAKDDGVICGIPLMKKVFVNLDKGIKITLKKKDGEKVKKGDIIATIKGKARAILMGERLALNLLQLMSGIATSANRFQSIAKPYGVTILDTRKTTPMLRVIEKYAVHTGGAWRGHPAAQSNIMSFRSNSQVEAATAAILWPSSKISRAVPLSRESCPIASSR